MAATTTLGLRMAPTLRDTLAARAAANGRSLNSEILQRLTDTVARRNDPIVSTLVDVLDLPKVVRVRSGNTTDDVGRIAAICERLGADDLLLAATANDLNHACLVAILQTPRLTCVLDSSLLNMARRPRIGEIEQLFQRLDLLGVLDSARYCTRLVPATEHLTPAEAVAVIVRDGQPAPMNLKAYLDLLSGHGLYDLARFRSAAVAVPVET